MSASSSSSIVSSSSASSSSSLSTSSSSSSQPKASSLDDEENEEQNAEETQKMQATYVKLISKEGHEFIVSKECAMISGTIRSLLLGPGQWKEKASTMPEVRLESISTPVLETVIQYFHYKKRYDSTPPPLPEFKLNMESIVPLLLAANFLDT
eukprot:TRINITY_DN11925_c0_g1_i1.p1 TRINITY_DN11925_c0_g1~~TRINITY_DN11925_c0_g1_i1.p1  ORF type:complete len:153 (+),score=50.69 TRINITY_DN11925_c0_g1_i1:60-518(+)